MAWVVPRTWVAGELVTAALMNQLRDALAFLGDVHDHSGDAGDGSTLAFGITKIAEVELASAAANVDFSSIPATHRGLWIVASVRPVNDNVQLYLRMNNDAGANYQGGANQIVVNTNGPSMGSAANEMGAFALSVPNYAEIVLHKMVTGTIGHIDSAGNMSNEPSAGRWLSTIAITRLTFLFSGGNVDTGTIITLYGTIA